MGTRDEPSAETGALRLSASRHSLRVTPRGGTRNRGDSLHGVSRALDATGSMESLEGGQRTPCLTPEPTLRNGLPLSHPAGIVLFTNPNRRFQNVINF